jgi:hypothetical protein
MVKKSGAVWVLWEEIGGEWVATFEIKKVGGYISVRAHVGDAFKGFPEDEWKLIPAGRKPKGAK